MTRELRRLFAHTGRFGQFCALLVARSPFDAVDTFLNAAFLAMAFAAVEGGSQQALWRACLLYGVGRMALFGYNGTVWTAYASFLTGWTASLRARLFDSITGLSLREIEGRPSGEWITRLNADMRAGTAAVSEALHLPHAACAVVNILVSAVLLLLQSPLLLTLSAACVVPHALISQQWLAKPQKKLYRISLEETARSTAGLGALIACADTALLYGAQDFLLERFAQSSLDLRRANMRMRWRAAAQDGLTGLFGMGGYLLLLLAGDRLVARGLMTFGGLTAALQLRGGMIKGAMMLLASLMNLRAAGAGVTRLNETMDMRAEEET